MASFTNQATLSYSGGTTTSNIVTGEVVATFSAAKTAVTEQYAPGDTVTYVVSILNTSDSPLIALTVSDDLGGYTFDGDTLYPLSYVEGSLVCLVNGTILYLICRKLFRDAAHPIHHPGFGQLAQR